MSLFKKILVFVTVLSNVILFGHLFNLIGQIDEGGKKMKKVSEEDRMVQLGKRTIIVEKSIVENQMESVYINNDTSSTCISEEDLIYTNKCNGAFNMCRKKPLHGYCCISSLSYPPRENPKNFEKSQEENKQEKESKQLFKGCIYQMKNAYLFSRGVISDGDIMIYRGGCIESFSNNDNVYLEEGRRVQVFPRVIALFIQFRSVYFHHINEVLKAALLVRDFLEVNPEYVIVTDDIYVELLWTFLNLKSISIESFPTNSVLFAEEVIIPTVDSCMKSTPPLSLFMRQYIHSLVSSLVSTDYPLTIDPIQSKGMKVVLLQNKEKGHIQNLIDLKKVLENKPGVTVSLVVDQIDNILSTMILFSNTTVVIGLNGPGLSNSIFMPTGSCVIELRSDDIYVPSISNLAQSLDLLYYVFDVEGSKKDQITLSDLLIERISDLIDRIRGNAKERQMLGTPDPTRSPKKST